MQTYRIGLVAASLDLTNGGFFGKLPTELGLLTHMRQLYLSENNFDGVVPSELGFMSILGELSFFA